MVAIPGGLSAPWVRITRIQAGDTRWLPHPWTGDDGLVGTRGDVAGRHPHRPADHDARQLGPWMAWGDHRCGRMRSSLPRARRHASLSLIGYALTTSCHVGALSAGLSSCTLAERSA